jgi:hypothetical protein
MPNPAPPFSTHRPLITTALLALLSSLSQAEDPAVHPGTVARFATITEARAILGARDRFVAALSRFDRQSRVASAADVPEDEFLRFTASQAVEWNPEQIALVTGAIDRLRQKLAPYTLPLPPTLVLVQTTGREEGNAAYCRGNAIVLPASRLDSTIDAIERLMNHELFHILSTHDAPFRERMYRIIGFRVCPPVPAPAELRDRKITNPDAPLWDAVITVRSGEETVAAVPILYASVPHYDPQHGGPFFRFLVFRLMAVRPLGDQWEAIAANGGPMLLDPAAIPDFASQIGRNTRYTLHPDEILADNFVHLIQQTPSLPSPEIVQHMRAALQNP